MIENAHPFLSSEIDLIYSILTNQNFRLPVLLFFSVPLNLILSVFVPSLYFYCTMRFRWGSNYILYINVIKRYIKGEE